MQKILELYKKEGETPLETIESFKRENPEYEQEKMTYAGRLDPMAEGVLLVLVGEECKNKEKYLGLDKEYEFEILWGFQTDTYDILGIPTKSKLSDSLLFDGRIKGLKGKLTQKYPPYSSMTVEGKQLFQWAREGRLDEIEIPENKVEIYKIDIIGKGRIEREVLEKEIMERINKVKGDFRQAEIKDAWKNILTKNLGTEYSKYIITKVRIKCSGGTYVRGIANELGGLAYSIKRTKIFTPDTF